MRQSCWDFICIFVVFLTHRVASFRYYYYYRLALLSGYLGDFKYKYYD